MSTLAVRARMKLGEFALDVDFSVPARGITALFGPSGCGKTTVLRCVAGLVRPSDARIVLGTERWQDEADGLFVPPHKRSCGYVFQEASLFPHLTVQRNLEYGWRRVPQNERRVDYQQAVELLGIAPLLARRAGNLSGGERQRVAIARAVLASPKLLLMDEPLAAIDARRRSEVLYYIERLRDELQLPILYVTHSMEEVVRLADSVVLMTDGSVVDVGPVAGRVVSDAAIIDTHVAEHDLAWGLARLDFPGGSLYASDIDALVGERVRVRILARDVSLALEAPRSASFLNVLEATVTSISEGEGASVDVRLDVCGTPLTARLTRRSVAKLSLAPGMRAYALIKSVALDRASVGYA